MWVRVWKNNQSLCVIVAESEEEWVLWLQPHLNARLNLWELVHDGEDGLHGAATAQVRLVPNKDDGNSNDIHERWVGYADPGG